MFLLVLRQEEVITNIGLFESVEEGRAFISQIPGYKAHTIDGFLYENINPDYLPTYLELDSHGNSVPFSKFMFTESGPIEIDWIEVPDLSKQGTGIVLGWTRVDAYHVGNEKVKDYITKREANFDFVKKHLEEKNCEVSRAYFGSQDGEAILYRKKDEEDWHFLTHLDPNFTEGMNQDDLLELIEEVN